MVSDKLPSVLSFPNSKQNSLSTFRALKNAREVIEILANGEDLSENDYDRIQVALDDLELMMGSVGQ